MHCIGVKRWPLKFLDRNQKSIEGDYAYCIDTAHTGGIMEIYKSKKDNYVAEPLALDEQNKYIRTDGTVGTIMTDGSSPKHNNRVIETKLTFDEPLRGIDAITELLDPRLTPDERFRKSREMAKAYRIRKLTPKECWRLMGFSDEDFEKSEKVCSNTQLYKQAGNSIVVNVLMGIFWELLL